MDPRMHTDSTFPFLPSPLEAMSPFKKEILRLDSNLLVREPLIWPWNRGLCSLLGLFSCNFSIPPTPSHLWTWNLLNCLSTITPDLHRRESDVEWLPKIKNILTTRLYQLDLQTLLSPHYLLLWIRTASFSSYSSITQHYISRLLASSSPLLIPFPSFLSLLWADILLTVTIPDLAHLFTANFSSPAFDITFLAPLPSQEFLGYFF